MEKRIKREKRYLHIQHRNKISSIISVLIHSYELSFVNNIYDYKNSIQSIKNCMESLSGLNLDDQDYTTAYRVIHRKHSKDLCDLDIDLPSFSMEIVNGLLEQDHESILCRMYENMRDYWDEVILSYKNKSAKTKRLYYLVERLDNEMKDPLIYCYHSVLSKIIELRTHYTDQLK